MLRAEAGCSGGGRDSQHGCSSVLSPEQPQLTASCAWAFSITFITPCSLIDGEESKDPKVPIVINNRLATAELIFHQGLLLASRRNGRERREERGSLAVGHVEDCLEKSSPPPKASWLFPLHLLPKNFRATATTFLVVL